MEVHADLLDFGAATLQRRNQPEWGSSLRVSVAAVLQEDRVGCIRLPFFLGVASKWHQACGAGAKGAAEDGAEGMHAATLGGN